MNGFDTVGDAAGRPGGLSRRSTVRGPSRLSWRSTASAGNKLTQILTHHRLSRLTLVKNNADAAA